MNYLGNLIKVFMENRHDKNVRRSTVITLGFQNIDHFIVTKTSCHSPEKIEKQMKHLQLINNSYTKSQLNY